MWWSPTTRMNPSLASRRKTLRFWRTASRRRFRLLSLARRKLQPDAAIPYKVAYRRGYYADNAKEVKAKNEQPGDPLLPLMNRGLPDFSQILYKVRVTPSNPQPPPDAARAGDKPELKGPCTRYGVDFAVAVDDLAFETTTDGLRGSTLEVMLIAYDRDGKPLNSVVRKREPALKLQSYAAAQAAGLQLHFEIDVPTDLLARNNVYLHAGIYDVRTSNAGTLEVPLHLVTAAA